MTDIADSFPAKLETFFQEHTLFRGLSDEEQAYLESVCEFRKLGPGVFFIRSGEKDADVCLILHGKVEVLVKNQEIGVEIPVRTIGEGETIGELSFIDGSPRSASVRTIEETEILIVPREKFQKKTPLIQGILGKLHYNIAVINAGRLKDTSADFVKSLQREVNLLKEQVQFGALFVYMILLFGINGLVLDIISKYFGDLYFIRDPRTMAWNTHFNLGAERLIAWGGALLMGVPLYFLIKRIGFPIRDVLSIRKNFSRSVGESLLVAGVLVGAALFLAMGPLTVPGVPKMKTWPGLYYAFVITVPDYLFHSYFQELCSRGVMQNAIQRFLRDEEGHRTVWVSSFAFGIMHSHLGWMMVIGSCLASVFFGYIYLRHKNLIGVSIIHYTIGILGRFFKVISLV